MVASLIGVLSVNSGAMLVVLFPLLLGMGALAIHWTKAAEPGLSWILGWFLLSGFVILGSCGICGLLGVLWDSAKVLFGF